jgi:TRAP-type C4-dicarboxylate transport system permease large subunit
MFQKIITIILVASAFAVAYTYYKWSGVAIVVSGLVTWALLHFSRMMQILKRAANRPIGYVDSAVMLNAKLQQGKTLMHVIAMTKALGELLSVKDVQPEVFRWTDGTKSHVTCAFLGGKLQSWVLFRPVEPSAEVLAEKLETELKIEVS